jgi:2-keto-3-deoxy-L-fuconate dehydrogenase
VGSFPRAPSGGTVARRFILEESVTFDLSGKTALVTAAGAGIGRASALALAEAGAAVTATDVDMDALATLGHEAGGIETRRLDCTDGEAIAALAGDITAPDILVNCSGWVHHGTILDVDDAVYDRAFDLNVRAHVLTIRAFLPGMIARGGGSIVNISSAAGVYKGAPNRAVYGATKAALIGLTKAVAADFIKDGIRCNAVCPGTIDTPSLRERIRAFGDEEEGRRAFMARQPSGRFGTADEIGALVLYLASDEAAFVTGQAHIIDGGWTL